jgi:hypothetical protein
VESEETTKLEPKKNDLILRKFSFALSGGGNTRKIFTFVCIIHQKKNRKRKMNSLIEKFKETFLATTTTCCCCFTLGFCVAVSCFYAPYFYFRWALFKAIIQTFAAFL